MFSEELAYEYMNEYAARFCKGEITKNYYHSMRKGAERMLAVAGGNVPNHGFPKRGSRYKFNNYYENLLLNFTKSENFHKNTLGDIIWVARKFFFMVV